MIHRDEMAALRFMIPHTFTMNGNLMILLYHTVCEFGCV